MILTSRLCTESVNRKRTLYFKETELKLNILLATVKADDSVSAAAMMMKQIRRIYVVFNYK